MKLIKTFKLGELHDMGVAFGLGCFWLFFETVAKELGYDKALELLKKTGAKGGEVSADYFLDLFKEKEMPIPMMIQAAEFIHGSAGHDVDWVECSEKRGVEQIKSCPVSTTMQAYLPLSYREQAPCYPFCKAFVEKFYREKLSGGKAKITRKGCLSKGDPYCEVTIEIP